VYETEKRSTWSRQEFEHEFDPYDSSFIDFFMMNTIIFPINSQGSKTHDKMAAFLSLSNRIF